MNKNTLFTIFFFCILFPQFLSSQSENNKFERLTVTEGLSNNSGLCILQDKEGFLWIGTQNGLSRYDGYSVKKFLQNPGDNTSISGNYINSIFEDSEGIIWVGTNKAGLNKYNKITNTFKYYQNNSTDPFSLGEGSVYSINEDKFGNLWVGVNPSGLYLFDKKSEQFIHFKENQTDSSSIKGQRVFTIFKDLQNELWIGTDGGLNKLEINKTQNNSKFDKTRGNNIAQYFSLLNEFNIKFSSWSKKAGSSNSLVHNNIISIYEESGTTERTFWIGTEGGLSKMIFDKNGNANFKNYKHDPEDSKSISSDGIWSILKDSEGILWIGTVGKGLNIFNPAKQEFINYTNGLKNKFSSGNYTVRFILEDRSGVLWFGTEDVGVLKLISNRKKFHVYQKNLTNVNSLSDNNVTSISEDSKKTIWIGTRYGGINRLTNPGSPEEEFTHYISNPEDRNSLLHNNIRQSYEDQNGEIWIASWNSIGGLNKYNPALDNFAHYQHDPDDPNSLSDNQVRVITGDNQGNLWIGTAEAGIDKFNIENETFLNFKHNASNSNSLSDNAVIDIYPDGVGNFWIPTFNGGLNKFDYSTETFTHFVYEQNDPYSINSNRVWSVYQDDSDRMWIGTDRGLNYLDRSTGKFYHFTESDGLCNNSVYGILEDNRSNLWLSTQNGLSKFEILSSVDQIPESFRFVNYGLDDNLPFTEFTSGAQLKSSSGEFYFGGVNGLIKFYPDSITNNQIIPPVVITSFKYFEEEAELDSSITTKKTLVIPYSNNFFSLEFAALDFQSPEKNQYAYKLEGLNDEWIFSGNRRYVSFSHLDPGNYIFKVKASNNDGYWNEAGKSISIIIDPPFWLTIWFRIISSMLLMTILILTIRYFVMKRYRKRMREFEIQQKIQDERERISGELHDSIGANLTSIVTGLEITKKYSERKELDNLNRNIDSVEIHTKNTIDELRQTIWSLHSNVKCVNDLNEKIKEYILHKIKLDDKPKVKFRFEGDSNIKLSPNNALNLFRIIQEATNNSVKYAECLTINIKIKTNNKILTIKITDDGKGFDPEDGKYNSDGFGIMNMKNRAAKINATLIIDSAINKGTTIKVELNTAN